MTLATLTIDRLLSTAGARRCDPSVADKAGVGVEHLRGVSTLRRCLECSARWTPFHPIERSGPRPCCATSSRPDVDLEDETPIRSEVQNTRTAAADADIVLGVGIEADDRALLDLVLGKQPEHQTRVFLGTETPPSVVELFDAVLVVDPCTALPAMFPYRTGP